MKDWFNKHAERILFIGVFTVIVAVLIGIGLGMKALELLFYKWVLGF